ncbi:histidine kinase [Methylobacillus gramineus]|uniref:PAS domain-containing sensor histidine kinase n=1 Tax=Methylobacillus gramineus TaxID=755169 RepID=UPI001CFFB68F|nr:sensor histidine kinase [Methylobacillus gramineus]MCB5183752.1 histidine kinase [Methylobacillus gramineus]
MKGLSVPPLSEIRQYLEAAAHSSLDDVYVIDPVSLKVVTTIVHGEASYASGSRSDDLLMALDQPLIKALLQSVEKHHVLVDLTAYLIDISMYFDQFRMLMVTLGGQQRLIVLQDGRAFSQHILHALNEGESKLSAMISNTPGVVYQARMNKDGAVVFLYLSDACKPLLGEDAETFIKQPALFQSMLDPDDLAGYEKSLRKSAKTLSVFNWTGRFWIEEWQDIKWINLRASPRKMEDDTIFWEGIMTNITQSRQEQQAIRQSHQRLAELSAHMAQIKEKERLKIAREIHDDLGGNLTAIRLGLSSIIKRLGPEQDVLQAKVRQLESIVNDTFEAAHRIASDMRPNVLELGIVAALEWQAVQFSEQIGISCDFVSSHAEIPLSTEYAITLFRICQEAMSNIAKYAQATQVEITLEYSADYIVMRVMDNGIGIAPVDALKPDAFGLRGMTERAVALSGQCKVHAGLQGGTIVTTTLPVIAG